MQKRQATKNQSYEPPSNAMGIDLENKACRCPDTIKCPGNLQPHVWICQTCRHTPAAYQNKRYTQYQAKTNGEIFQNHALDIMSRMTDTCGHDSQSFIPTNITIAVIHSVQNCRNMVVNYVLHPYDIIVERYAYEKRRMKTNNIPGDPTPISIQTCRRHEWLTMWNSDVTVKWINYYRPLSYIASPILYEPIDFIPWTHHATPRYDTQQKYEINL